MKRHQTIFRGASERGRSPSQAGLPPEQLERARQRLALIAGFFAALFALGTAVGLLAVTIDLSDLIPGAPSRRFVYVRLAVNVVSLAISLAMVWAARSESRPIALVLRLGLLFEVYICFQIALFSIWYTSDAENLVPWLNWSTPVIIIFAAMVPATPGRTFRAALAAAAMNPAAVGVLQMLQIVPFDPSDLLRVTGSPVIASFLAARISQVLHSLGVDLAQAKRMGSYQLESLLGRGGMGEVWSATHSLLARPAAIKLISRQSDGTQASGIATKRFEREARATAALHSPHSVMLYDFGTTDDGTFYYVMELLDGLDLSTLVAKYGAQPAGRVVHILEQACDSLMDAHHGGLVHRDIKPANLFLCKKGLRSDWVKVLDFGLVSLKGGNTGDPTLTAHGFAGGTPAFMAPEQAAGQEVDGRADIYALGCVAYWLLSGQLVFEGDSALAVIVAHARDEPPALSTMTEMDIPEDLEALVMRCLDKDPTARPQTAQALAEALAGLACATDWSRQDADHWWKMHHPERASK
ncbi:MAG: hypothetical protein ACI9OJ_001777 [Myxococcota bacterium]|jgi:hypothetical protein